MENERERTEDGFALKIYIYLFIRFYESLQAIWGDAFALFTLTAVVFGSNSFNLMPS